jgi:hypothetical protein
MGRQEEIPFSVVRLQEFRATQRCWLVVAGVVSQPLPQALGDQLQPFLRLWPLHPAWSHSAGLLEALVQAALVARVVLARGLPAVRVAVPAVRLRLPRLI